MIYFIQSGDRVKIGYGKDGWKRVREVMTYSPHELKLLGVRPGARLDEAELHKRFAKHRLPIRQRDWFVLADEIKEFIALECVEMTEEPKTSIDTPYREVGRRLELFRLAKGIKTHKAFIAGTDISHSSYADAENGKKSLGMSTAMKLIARHPELSLDYIYLGRIGTLDNHQIRNAIPQIQLRKRPKSPATW